MELPLSGQQMTEVREALFRGDKIGAIKIYRQATDSELRVAKQAVDGLEKELRRTTPESFRPIERRGCLGVILMVLAIGSWLLFGLLR